MAKKPKYKFELQVSKDIHKAKAKVKAFNEWLQEHPEFIDQRPDVADFIAEALRKGSAMQKAGVLEASTKKAAQLHWESEANYYLRHVQTVRINIKTKVASEPTKAYVQVRSSGPKNTATEQFETAKRVFSDPALKKHVMQLAMEDFDNWVRRYENSADFYETFSELLAIYRATRTKMNSRIRNLAG